jgi:tight adherence protein C
MVTTILSLTFVAVTFGVYALAYRPHAVAVKQRMDDYLAERAVQVPGAARLSAPVMQRLVAPMLQKVGKLVWRVTPKGVMESTQAKLDAAGNPPHIGVAEFMGLRLLSPLAIVPLTIFSARWLDFSYLVTMVWWVGGIAIGVFLPDYALQKYIETRQTKIRRSLADVVDLLAVSVEAGVGFDGAMQKVTQKLSGPLPEEMGRVLEQVRLGKSRGESLKEMARRTQVGDLVSFVAAIHQAEVLGVSIAQVLRVQAQTVRERRSQRAREMAAKLPVKLLFPLVFFIFPALFVVILGPGIIQIAPVVFKVLGKH